MWLLVMKVKLYLTLAIDPEEYTVPSDGLVADEIQETIENTLYDIEGIEIKNIKIIQE